MRRLRVTFATLGSGLPVLVGVALLPTEVGCGASTVVTSCEAGEDASAEAASDVEPDSFTFDVPVPEDAGVCSPGKTVIVELPPPGVPAEAGQICAVATPSVASSGAARVTLTDYMPDRASGTIAIAPGLVVVGDPTLTVKSDFPQFAAMTPVGMKAIPGGFAFEARWPAPLTMSYPHNPLLQVEVTLSVACEAGTRTVRSITNVVRCLDGGRYSWQSSGDACVMCEVIAEMAPSPIPSDNPGDDLPLGRVIRVRVIEVARGANGVLLFAENDAGQTAECQWRVSGGTLQRIADDLVFWAPPMGTACSYGQVALANEDGAVVENFLWATA